MLLGMKDHPVHIISTPYASPAGRAKAEGVKCQQESPPHSYCYNPNTDCDQTGQKGWLETWFKVLKVTKATQGKVFMLYNSDKRGKFGHGLFDGMTQPGELSVAL